LPKNQTASRRKAGQVLAVNIGSSSLKFALYSVHHEGRVIDVAHVVGLIEGLQGGLKGGSSQLTLILKEKGGTQRLTVTCQPGESPLDAALAKLRIEVNRVLNGHELLAVAHRIVHGGNLYRSSVQLTPEVIQDLSQLNPLAPLHQPYSLAGAQAMMRAFDQTPQFACFDTAFHQTLLPLETHFGLPELYFEQGIRRYGFHGLSYAYVAGRLMSLSKATQGRLLMAHLGNGASLCAAVNGRSVATTMGFTALDGLLMGTRSGSIDPGLLLYWLQQGWSPEKISDLLYKKSGLLGVSGVSADMRTLHESKSPQAAFAIDLFVHRIVREAGALIAVMGGINAIAFTGGVGEHDADVRHRVCDALSYLGVYIEPSLNINARGDRIAAINSDDSPIEVWVVPTDEGRIAAEEALKLLQQRV
jgi:acetate kinase